MLNSQERREYIAKEILKWKFLRKHNSESGFYIMSNWAYDDNGRIISMPRVPRAVMVEKLPDFESLPEWVGPICDVVFPMLSEKGWSISFLGNGYASLCGPLGWAILDIRTGPISTVLVDAHIKIENDKMESFKDDLKIISDFSNEELNSLELAFHKIPHEKEIRLSFFATFVEGAKAYRDMQTQNPKGKQNGN